MKFVTTLATINVVSQIMIEYMKDEKKKELVPEDLQKKDVRLIQFAASAYTKRAGKPLSKKELKKHNENMRTMAKYGLENIGSFQTYISFCIGLAEDRIKEINGFVTKDKYNIKRECLIDIRDKMISIYGKYSDQNEDAINYQLDSDAGKLLHNFNLLF